MEIKPIPNEEYIGEKLPDIKGNVHICPIHTKKDWMLGEYEQVRGGIKCKNCAWGTRIPGYMRVLDGKIIDLRTISSQETGQ